MRGNLFAHLNRVVIEGSHGVGKRVKRQVEGSRTDFKKFSCEVFSAVCKTVNRSTLKCASVRHVASVAVDDSESPPLYSFNLVNF